MVPKCFHAGRIGSCTANALAAAVFFDKPTLMPSRLFIYYNERALEGDVADDSGACLADGIKVGSIALRYFSEASSHFFLISISTQALQEYGVCDEKDYPYHDDKVGKGDI